MTPFDAFHDTYVPRVPECWYDWFCIVFDDTLHIISLADSACQAHPGIEDSSMCLSNILVYAESRRQ